MLQQKLGLRGKQGGRGLHLLPLQAMFARTAALLSLVVTVVAFSQVVMVRDACA